MNESSYLTVPQIGQQFATLLRSAMGARAPRVQCERVNREDVFGPVDVIEIRWGGEVAHLKPHREALVLSIEDYSRLFLQPIAEEWLARRNALERVG